MIIKQLCNELESIYKQYFPRSYISVKWENRFYSSIWISAHIAKDRTECVNGYLENDMMFCKLQILAKDNKEFDKTVNNETDYTDEIVIVNERIGYFIKPTNQYNVYSHKKVAFRKTIGTAEKIIEVFEKLVIKLKQQLVDDLKNDIIHNNHIEILKIKLDVY